MTLETSCFKCFKISLLFDYYFQDVHFRLNTKINNLKLAFGCFKITKCLLKNLKPVIQLMDKLINIQYTYLVKR